MRVRYITILVAAVVFIIAATAQTALAGTQTAYFADGSYAVSEDTSSGQGLSSTGSLIPLSSGSGGTPSKSGYRTVWVKTTYYSVLGTVIITFKTSIYWEWKGSVVTTKHWNATQQTTPGPFIFYDGTTNGPSGWQTWNGHAHGLWYGSRIGHFHQDIPGVGAIKRWHPLHEYWIRGNGTYRWEATT